MTRSAPPARSPARCAVTWRWRRRRWPPAVPAKGNAGPPPVAVKAFIAKLAAEQARALANSTWVGSAFPARARAMHAGDEAHATIHGQATVAEARALADEGVPVAPLPLPVVPPEAKN